MRTQSTTTIAVVMSGIVISGQVAPVAPKAPPREVTTTVTRKAMPQGVRSMIHGTVVDIDSKPLPRVPVRLRNLKSNAIEQRSTANQLGEFTFVAEPDVPYVVEVNDVSGRVVAVGNVMVVQAGEIGGALVRIPTRLEALGGIFGETAGSVISAIAGTGMTALESSMPYAPLTPEQ